MPQIIRETETGLVMENQILEIRFHHKSPTIEVYDLRTDFSWEQHNNTAISVGEYAKKDNSVDVLVSTGAGLEMIATWRLADELPELCLHLTPRQETKFESFNYPPPFIIDSGFHTIPHSQGILFSVDDERLRRFLEGQKFDAYTSDLSMPWFGSVFTPTGHGYIGILETSEDASVGFDTFQHPEGSLLTVSPFWRSSLGKLNYERSMRYCFFTDDGYVSQAKIYKAYLKAKGTFPNSENSPKGNLAVSNKMKGACHLNIHIGKLNFEDTATICRQFKNLGIEKAIVHLRNWVENPYHAPQLLPPSSEAGGQTALASLIKTLDSLGYTPGIAVGFRDTYEGFKGFKKSNIVKDAAGAPVYGGYWGASRVPALRVCGEVQSELAKKHLPDAIKAGPFQSVLLENACLDARECYAKRHPLSRGEDLDSRKKLFRECRHPETILGAEGAMDFAVPWVDFISGQMSLSRFYFIEQSPAPHQFNLDPCMRVPLFNLVYHECTNVTWHHEDSYLSAEDNGTRALFDLLYGNPPTVTISHPGTMKLHGENIAEVCNTVSRLHEKTAGQELLVHGWLTEDRLVQVSRFKSGLQIIANFSREHFKLPKEGDVAPGGCMALLP